MIVFIIAILGCSKLIAIGEVAFSVHRSSCKDLTIREHSFEQRVREHLRQRAARNLTNSRNFYQNDPKDEQLAQAMYQYHINLAAQSGLRIRVPNTPEVFASYRADLLVPVRKKLWRLTGDQPDEVIIVAVYGTPRLENDQWMVDFEVVSSNNGISDSRKILLRKMPFDDFYQRTQSHFKEELEISEFLVPRDEPEDKLRLYNNLELYEVPDNYQIDVEGNVTLESSLTPGIMRRFNLKDLLFWNYWIEPYQISRYYNMVVTGGLEGELISYHESSVRNDSGLYLVISHLPDELTLDNRSYLLREQPTLDRAKMMLRKGVPLVFGLQNRQPRTILLNRSSALFHHLVANSYLLRERMPNYDIPGFERRGVFNRNKEGAIVLIDRETDYFDLIAIYFKKRQADFFVDAYESSLSRILHGTTATLQDRRTLTSFVAFVNTTIQTLKVLYSLGTRFSGKIWIGAAGHGFTVNFKMVVDRTAREQHELLSERILTDVDAVLSRLAELNPNEYHRLVEYITRSIYLVTDQMPEGIVQFSLARLLPLHFDFKDGRQDHTSIGSTTQFQETIALSKEEKTTQQGREALNRLKTAHPTTYKALIALMEQLANHEDFSLEQLRELFPQHFTGNQDNGDN